MSRDHQRLREQLAIYNNLTLTEQAKLQAHVQVCPECKAHFTASQQIDRDLAALERLTPSPKLRAEFQAKLAAKAERHPIFRFIDGWQQAPRLVGQALVLIFLASLVGVMWLSLQQRPFLPTASAPAVKSTMTPTATAMPTSQPTVAPQPVWRTVPQPTVQFGRSTIASLAVAADGQTIATGNTARYVQLWQLANGEQSGNWAMPYGTAASLAFSPNGRWLAAGSTDYEGYVMLWPTTGDSTERRLDEPNYSVTTLAFSPDSTLLAAGTGRGDGQVYLWQLPGHTLQTTLDPQQAVSAMAFSPDGRLLVTGTIAGMVQMWQVTDGREAVAFSASAEAISTVAFSPDGQTVAVGTADGMVQLYVLPDMTLMTTLDGETAVQTMAFSANGTYLASVSSGGQVNLWQTTDSSPTLLFSTEIEALANFQTELLFQDDQLKVIAAYRDGRIRVWQIQSE